jgi:invasion protein IalB
MNGYGPTIGNSSRFRPALTLLVAMTAILLGAGTAHGAKDGDKFKEWTMRCESPQGAGEVCHLFQVAKDEESGRDIVHVAIGYRADRPEPLAIISVPLGIFLPPGVALQVDQGEPIRAPYEVCDPDACRAGFPLTPDMVTKLKGGLALTVTLENALGQTKTMPISLSGFTAGLGALPK